MNGEMERGAVGETRDTFYAFLLLCLGFLIGSVYLRTIIVAPKQLIRHVIELREGINKTKFSVRLKATDKMFQE